MLRTKQPVKYAEILPNDCIEGLRYLVGKNVISSVNQGIRVAVESFVAQQKKKDMKLYYGRV